MRERLHDGCKAMATAGAEPLRMVAVAAAMSRCGGTTLTVEMDSPFLPPR